MDITLTAFYKAAIKRFWIILICLPVGLAAGYMMSLQSRVTYAATVRLLGLDTEKVIFGETATDRDIDTSEVVARVFVEIVNSYRVALAASRNLSANGFDLAPEAIQPMVSAIKPEGSSFINLTATSLNPAIVIPVANAVAQAFEGEVEEIMGANYVNILDEAQTVRTNSGTPMITYLSVGLAGGGILGATVIYLLIVLDDKIRTANDIEKLSDVRVILIPDNLID